MSSYFGLNDFFKDIHVGAGVRFLVALPTEALKIEKLDIFARF